MAKRTTDIPEFVIEVGTRLRKIRIEKGMSIEEVAYKAGIDAQNLRKYELGKQEMKISMFKRILESLGVTMGDLFN